MTSNQHIPPLFAPPANHWLRAVLGILRDLTCAKLSEGRVEVAEVDVAVQQRGAFGSVTTLPGVVVTDFAVDSVDPTAVTLDGILKYRTGIDAKFELYSAGNIIVEITSAPEIEWSDSFTFDYVGDLIPGVSRYSATHGNLWQVHGGVTGDHNFTVTFAALPDGPPVEPTVLLSPNQLARSTIVENTGQLSLDIYEGGVLVAIVPPRVSIDMPLPPGTFAFNPTAQLPMGGRLEITAMVSAGVSTAGRTASAKISRSTRNLCGEMLVEIPIEHEGGDLV